MDKEDSALTEIRQGRDISPLDLHSIDQLSLEDISLIFELSHAFKKYKTHKFSLNRNRTMINVFFESSTRTMASFDLSGKHMGMDTTNVKGSGSSVDKGETILDTMETLDAYNPVVIVVRSSEAGVSEFISRHTSAAIINCGDGWHEHPTQGLLDAMTITEHFGTEDLSGKVVTIVGDIRHSRVFGSLVRILNKLGATIRVAAPQSLIPFGAENFGVELFYNLEDALPGSDVIYTLRVQRERGSVSYIPTLREYSKLYGISEKRLNMANDNVILMHPGPVQRDIDIHSALVAADGRSRVLSQVENGMAIRKSLLWLLGNRMDGRVKERVLL